MVKNFGSKKLRQKGYCKGLVKKTLVNVVTYIANHQWLINSKTKPTKQFQTSMNIIIQTPYFPGFVLCHMVIACCLIIAWCTVEFMIHGYHKYISKLLLESGLELLKYYNIDILTLIFTRNKLKHSSCCCVRLMLQKQENWQKKLVNYYDLPNLL